MLQLNKLKRFLRRWLDDDGNELVCETVSVNRAAEGRLEGQKFSFSVIPAHGGNVVEVYHPDETKYHNHTGPSAGPTFTHHIIPDTEDFTEALGKIVTLEMLRR